MISPRPRTNADWLSALRETGVQQGTALDDLRRYLQRVLRRVVRDATSEPDLEDYVQESLGRILRHLDTFRGDSAFTTWASGIAVRVAFTELRRKKSRFSNTQSLTGIEQDILNSRTDDQKEPDLLLSRRSLVETLESAIESHLSTRQRIAITAELRGIPTITIAEHLGTNQNALYKLVHDARKRLKQAIMEAGYDEAAIRELISEGQP